ncbi:hypothetical protein FF38_01045 [Lucilia cuprina]|uniref:Uncharacterized protein n=1 Tax=Lucilia cuprina TaxID=7375 RepID=A0A0L0BTA5_LUCCU|nr:hypothetical protein FF38_01045 [Lucilia cuprina]
MRFILPYAGSSSNSLGKAGAGMVGMGGEGRSKELMELRSELLVVKPSDSLLFSCCLSKTLFAASKAKGLVLMFGFSSVFVFKTSSYEGGSPSSSFLFVIFILFVKEKFEPNFFRRCVVSVPIFVRASEEVLKFLSNLCLAPLAFKAIRSPMDSHHHQCRQHHHDNLCHYDPLHTRVMVFGGNSGALRKVLFTAPVEVSGDDDCVVAGSIIGGVITIYVVQDRDVVVLVPAVKLFDLPPWPTVRNK